jgi:hypothetical protein
MDTTTPFRYLIGDRAALEAIARSRHAVWVGLLFVLSAGLAREYDGEDLLHEPWHAFLPLAASLVSSGLLFLLAYSIARWKGIARPAGFFTQYRAFLALFWMTAPLAWLYALPHERLFDPVPAVVLNLVTLGLVSAWRVALMIWVLRAYFGYPLVSAAFLVLLFADVVVLVLIPFVPFPLIEVMGGIHVSESERILRVVTRNAFGLDCCSLPFLIVGSAVFVLNWGMAPQPWVNDERSGRPSWGLWILAGASVVVGLLLLPFTQPEQIRGWRVERAFAEGRLEEGFAILSAHEPDDFPPGWDPPPQADMFHFVGLVDCVEYAVEHDVAPWVREAYLEKLERVLHSNYLVDFDHTQGARVARLLFRIPEGPAILRRLEEEARYSYPFKTIQEEIEKLRSHPPTPEPQE